MATPAEVFQDPRFKQPSLQDSKLQQAFDPTFAGNFDSQGRALDLASQFLKGQRHIAMGGESISAQISRKRGNPFDRAKEQQDAIRLFGLGNEDTSAFQPFRPTPQQPPQPASREAPALPAAPRPSAPQFVTPVRNQTTGTTPTPGGPVANPRQRLQPLGTNASAAAAPNTRFRQSVQANTPQAAQQLQNSQPPPGPQIPQIQPPPIDTGTQAHTLTGFGPDNTLRDQQINPTDSPFQQGVDRLTGDLAGQVANQRLAPFHRIGTGGGGRQAQGLTNEALGNIRGATGILNRGSIGAGTFDGSAAGDQARSVALRALGGLEGPDRGQLAQNLLNRRQEERAPILEQQLRGVGQRAAALGRVGAGLTTNELTDVFTREQDAERRFSEGVLDNAAGQTLQDRLGVLSGALSAGGQFRGEDLSQAGFQQGLRNEARGERGQQAGFDSFNSELGLRRAGALGGLASDVFGRGSSLRGEQRGERDAGFGRQLANFGLQSGGLGQLGGLGNDLFGRGVQQRGELRQQQGFQNQLANDALAQRRQETLDTDFLGDRQFRRDLDQNIAIGTLGAGPPGADPNLLASSNANSLLQGQGDSTGELMRLWALSQGLE